MSILKRVLRREEGVTALEFAMVAPVLFVMIFAVIDYGMMMATQAALEAAVTKTARHYKAISRSSGTSDNYSQIKAEIMKTLTSGSYGIIKNPSQNLFVYANALGSNNSSWGRANDATGGFDNYQYNTNCGSGATGVKRSCSFFSGDVVQYQVKYDYKLMTPILSVLMPKIQLSASMVVQNEPDI